MSDNKELIAFWNNQLGHYHWTTVESEHIQKTIAAIEADKQGEAVDGISRIYQICNRYESGYGHGLKRDGLDLSKTPHSDIELGEAYQIGYEAGSERFEADKQGEAVALVPVDEFIAKHVNKFQENEKLRLAISQPDRKEIKRRDEVGEVLAAEGEFTKWFIANYPGPDTIIHNPLFHAPKIFSVAWANIRRARKEPIERKEIEDEVSNAKAEIQTWPSSVLEATELHALKGSK